MTKNSRLAAGVAAAVILLGGAIWGLRYALYPARRGNSLTLYGNVDIWEMQPAFNDNGPITAMYVTEGAVVRKGDLLARIDDSRYAASLAQARRQEDSLKATLDKLVHGSRPEEIAQTKATMEGLLAIYENNQALYARTVGLLPQGIASIEDRDNAQAAVRSSRQSYQAAKQVYVLAAKGPRVEDIDAARTAYRAAAAAADLAERQFADTRLYAASDGIVEDRILEIGDMASPGTPVYTIALNDPLWVRAYVAEADLGKLTLGRRATIATDSFPGRRYRGWVGYLSPSAEFTPKTVETPELRTRLVYQVRIYACDSRGQLRLGMPATVTIDLSPAPPGAAGADAPKCAGDHDRAD